MGSDRFPYAMPLERLLTKHVQEIGSEIKNRQSTLATNSTLHWYAKANPQGLVGGVVTFLPNKDPGEEAIELCFTLSPSEGGNRFTIDLCYSDGPVLENFYDSNISVQDVNALLSEIDKNCLSIHKAAIARLEQVSNSNPKKRHEGDPWP